MIYYLRPSQVWIEELRRGDRRLLVCTGRGTQLDSPQAPLQLDGWMDEWREEEERYDKTRKRLRYIYRK